MTVHAEMTLGDNILLYISKTILKLWTKTVFYDHLFMNACSLREASFDLWCFRNYNKLLSWQEKWNWWHQVYICSWRIKSNQCGFASFDVAVSRGLRKFCLWPSFSTAQIIFQKCYRVAICTRNVHDERHFLFTHNWTEKRNKILSRNVGKTFYTSNPDCWRYFNEMKC